MKKPKSNCCNAEIYELVIDIEYDHNDIPIYDYQEYCSECNQPCKVIDPNKKKK